MFSFKIVVLLNDRSRTTLLVVHYTTGHSKKNAYKKRIEKSEKAIGDYVCHGFILLATPLHPADPGTVLAR